MMKKRLYLVLLLGCLAAGCGKAAEESPPPMDLGAIKTEAVRTAVAEMTAQAILHPSPAPATPAFAAQPTLTLTAEPPALEDENETRLPEPTVDLTATSQEEVYTCEIDADSSLPPDSPQPAGAKIKKTWVVKNTGNVVWSSRNVKLKWVGGAKLFAADQIEWKDIVQPDNYVTFNVEILLSAEETNRTQIVEWGLVNERNEIFCKLYTIIPFTY